MNRVKVLLLPLVMSFPNVGFSGDFTIGQVALGMSGEELKLHLNEFCGDRCMTYNSALPGGVVQVTAYYRYQTIYFNNTRQHSVDNRKPYESVSYILSPERRVIGIINEILGAPNTVDDFISRIVDDYDDDLQEFSTQHPNSLGITLADEGTDRAIGLMSRGLKGKHFAITKYIYKDGYQFAGASYYDYDAVRAVEMKNKDAFSNYRQQTKESEPRPISSLELERLDDYDSVQVGTETKIVDDATTVEVVPGEISQILVNGTEIAKVSFLEDGVAFHSVQQLTPELYWIASESRGNGCSAQEKYVLRVSGNKSELLKPFGRCEETVKVNDHTVYFTFPATEYEPELSLAID